MHQQRTIAEKVSCTGVGLHTGVPVQLTMHPMRANSGVVFVRRHSGRGMETVARSSAVTSTSHATTLGTGLASVSTVEHLLAALYAFGVDNVRIEIDGPEVPAMDGSAAPFVYLIRSAGIFVQPEPSAVMRLRSTIEVSDGERHIRIEPASQFRISYAIDFEHPAIGRQELALPKVSPQIFEREIARSRTFGFLAEVQALRQAGLALGGSLKNSIVLDSKRVINSGGLRWRDEFVRHKVLDLLGDLSLLGLRLKGHVVVERGGHALHQRLVKEILARPEAWTIQGPVAGWQRGLDVEPPAASPA
ncbi:MAG: UDP-3-O-acyl-N-acetylglucosamine deacetylase [Deltaproteobacteria bacterium]|nr:UDP-3-O-acyl-N-acetylglucosamine deacetylase [Deltaproteobacteria bacterium]MBW2419588.1 UDP-3-O-acyl-N-acetylglucosamine deacetylase [Deltaproteobacteria bacterium]